MTAVIARLGGAVMLAAAAVVAAVETSAPAELITAGP
jgi:hypothetical protein